LWVSRRRTHVKGVINGFKLLSSIMIFVFIPDHVREKERDSEKERDPDMIRVIRYA